MNRYCLALTAISLLALAPAVRADRDYVDIVSKATLVLEEMRAASDGGVPPALMRKASGIVVIPSVIKGGFVIGARRGHGVLMARDPGGRWSHPVFVTLTGGSIGFQAGVESSDLILVIHSRRSVNDIVRRRKLTLNADAGVAAGPVGRQVGAGSDIEFRAEIYTYSRSRGLFAGASIDGSSLRLDYEGLEEFYGSGRVSPSEVFNGQVRSSSPQAQRLLATLTSYAGDASNVRRNDPPARDINAPPPASTEQLQPPGAPERRGGAKEPSQEAALVEAATASIRDLAGQDDRTVPRKVAEQAYAVAVVPDLVRAGFVAGGQYGRGVLVVRNWDGEWSNPTFIRVSGGGIGLQAGVQTSEWILVFKSRRAVNEVIRRRKMTIGVDAAASAGPIGREVGLATDADMRAEIFTYSKSRGLFAGAQLGGSIVRIDDEANEAFYNKDELAPAQIFAGEDIEAPSSVRAFRAALDRGFAQANREPAVRR